MNAINTKLKSKLKETEVAELKTKAEAVLKTLQTLKTKLEPIDKKIKAQMAQGPTPAPGAVLQRGSTLNPKFPGMSKSPTMPINNGAQPPAPKMKAPLEDFYDEADNKPANALMGTQVPNPDLLKPVGPALGTPAPAHTVSAKGLNSVKPPIPQGEQWRAGNATENQLKQRYYARKEKSMEKIIEIKKKIFNLKIRKYEMIVESAPKLLPKHWETWGGKLVEDTLKACEAYFERHLGVVKVIEMNDQAKKMNVAMMKNEVG